MVRESTDPGMHVLPRPDGDAPNKLSPLAVWLLVAGLIVTTGGAVTVLTGWGVLSSPWETKTEAETAHRALQGGIDDLREEQRARDVASSTKLDLILDRLPKPKKGK